MNNWSLQWPSLFSRELEPRLPCLRSQMCFLWWLWVLGRRCGVCRELRGGAFSLAGCLGSIRWNLGPKNFGWTNRWLWSWFIDGFPMLVWCCGILSQGKIPMFDILVSDCTSSIICVLWQFWKHDRTCWFKWAIGKTVLAVGYIGDCTAQFLWGPGLY